MQNNLHGQIIDSSFVPEQQQSSETEMDSSNNWLSAQTTNSTSCNLSLLPWNAQSLNKQITIFQSSENYDIIAITETWLHNHIYSKEILPTNYNILRNDHDSKGGGVLLAFKDSLNVKQLTSPNNLEILSAEVDSNLVLCLIYRPPNADHNDQHNSSLLSFLSSLDPTKNIAIIGDLNLPDADWTHIVDISDEFTELAFNLNLTQLVTGPTPPWWKHSRYCPNQFWRTMPCWHSYKPTS